MTIIHQPSYVESVLCDQRGCVAIIRPPSKVLGWNIRPFVNQSGWSTWVNRGTRHYCPEHGPKPGHKMRRVDQ